MVLENQINYMMMSIRQLSAENAMLRSILANSSDSRGFEQFYDIGDMPTRFGFMGEAMDEFNLPFYGKVLRRRFDFLG